MGRVDRVGGGRWAERARVGGTAGRETSMPYQLPLRCARAVPRGRGPLASNVSYLTEAGPTRGAVKLWRRGVCRVLVRVVSRDGAGQTLEDVALNRGA